MNFEIFTRNQDPINCTHKPSKCFDSKPLKIHIMGNEIGPFCSETRNTQKFPSSARTELYRSHPFRTAVPFRGQASQVLSGLSPEGDCVPERVKVNNIGKQDLSVGSISTAEITGPKNDPGLAFVVSWSQNKIRPPSQCKAHRCVSLSLFLPAVCAWYTYMYLHIPAYSHSVRSRSRCFFNHRSTYRA